MLIGVKKKFVFVANTKTASTSIEHALADYAEIMLGGSPNRKHMPLRRIPREYWFLFDRPKHRFDSYFRFGVMREPISWIDSWFRYRKGNQVASPLPAEMTFEDFWKARDWNIQTAKGEKYLQSTQFTGHDGTLLADVIIPYERIGDYLPRIFAALDVKAPLPRRNVSLLPRSSDPVPPALMEELQEFYQPDLEIYRRLDEINAEGMEKLESRTLVPDHARPAQAGR